MDLQNQQLKELNAWLTKTEERTRKMEKEPLGPESLYCSPEMNMSITPQ